ncbi:Putative pumilio-8-like protein [Morus notabilis]|uniref:Putative pumilio-8-like protein n=1 Tax=Morus notabilis TaxID=981085 RepID=W9QHA9_9ROSA|nr:Putative pumilio-8-like protein [Morus notabilis]
MIELVVYEENSSSDTRSIASQETQSYTSNHQQSYGFTENGVDLNGYNFPYHTPSYQHNDQQSNPGIIDNGVDLNGYYFPYQTPSYQSDHQQSYEFIDNGVNLNRYNSQALRKILWSDESRREIAKMIFHPEHSKLLQDTLVQNDELINESIFGVVFENMFRVMEDQYGTHVFGKLVECRNSSQLLFIVANITLNTQTFLGSLYSKPGANSAKGLIKVLKNSVLVYEITSILTSKFIELMSDRIASNVILQCLGILNASQNQILYEETIKNCLKLATDVKGCFALNESIDVIRDLHRTRLLQIISTHAVFISQEPSGNYVLQRVLELRHPIFINMVCSTLKGNYVNLSKQKFASHVVEKCLMTFGTKDVLEDLMMLRLFSMYLQSTNSHFCQELLERLEQDMDKFRTSYGMNVYNMVITGVI